MSSYLDKAHDLRNDPTTHHNCAQGVVIPFAADCGMTDDQAYQVCMGFGGGMCSGGTCGALIGTIMALGLEGLADRPTVSSVVRGFSQAHEGCTQCRDLLKRSHDRGEAKKDHCDGLVYEAVRTVERIKAERAEA